jgi:hypothetical protein
LKKIIGLKQGEDYSCDEKFKSLRYGHILLLTDQDSVTGDTPLLLKNTNNLIEIQTINQLTTEWINNGVKEYGITDYKVWTENGWTDIKQVIRHKVNKKMYRVITNSGVVDVTQDHSLLNKLGNKIKPTECNIETQLLHSFPTNFENNEISMSLDEIYICGLFWISGLCGIYYNKNNIENIWYLYNKDIHILNKVLILFKNIYPELEFKIINGLLDTNNEQIYKLILLNTGDNTNDFVFKYRNMFYSNNNKIIPIEILNSSLDVRNEFYKGCYDSKKQNIFKINGKQSSQCMYLLCKSLGYNISIKPLENNIFLLYFNNVETDNIINIIELEQTEQYVYDLETDNHHFQAGVGKLIVHNTDGTHIKGLVINMLHTLWPSLIKREYFIQSLNTPIVKAIKNKNVISFYNLTDYQKWKNKKETSGYNIKYYKGLGTSTSLEAKEYFNNITNKLITYMWKQYDDNIENIDNDSETYIPTLDDDIALELAFSKHKADERKQWLMSYNKDNIIKYEQKIVPYYDFVHYDLIHFSNEDVYRSIPSVIDGLKPSQRKILYGAFLRGLDKTEVKVAQLAGFVSDRAAYHHGEASLNSTIIGMAQNFVGSNNINILSPNGQFGTRLKGGSDASASRYIWTKLEKITTTIFNPIDNSVLNQLNDDGMLIEPEYYVPIIPMVLVNGIQGIGTGFSTKIPPYNPIDIIQNLKNKLKGQLIKPMDPWWRNFNGNIVKIDDYNYEIYGKWKISNNKLIITELPIGEWTSSYKEFLENMLLEQDKKPKNKKTSSLISYKDNNTDELIYFELTFENGYLEKEKDIDKTFKLCKKYSITNMHLYCPKGHIKKYNKVDDIIEDYYNVRLDLYQKRKNYLLNVLEQQLKIISYKVKFILMVINNKIEIRNKKKIYIENILEENNFPKLQKTKDENISYDYLLSMPLWNLTKEKIDELRKQKENKETEYNILLNKTNIDIWLEELDILENEYKNWIKKN